MPRQKKQFQNPTGYFHFGGPFVAELIDEASTKLAPEGTRVEGTKVFFPRGAIAGQSMGGITFQYRNRPVSWGYRFLVSIRREDGRPLWINNRMSHSE